ncbi:hypothetical protein, partial [Zooshikella harenae]
YKYLAEGGELINNKIEGYKIRKYTTIVIKIKSKNILGKEISYILVPYGIFTRPERFITYECSDINKFKYLPIKKSIDAWVFNKE